MFKDTKINNSLTAFCNKTTISVNEWRAVGGIYLISERLLISPTVSLYLN